MGLIDEIFTEIVMFLCSILYRRYGKAILCVKGTEREYPRYLLYTEDEKVYKRMDAF